MKEMRKINGESQVSKVLRSSLLRANGPLQNCCCPKQNGFEHFELRWLGPAGAQGQSCPSVSPIRNDSVFESKKDVLSH
jgi:hypothetical protein